MFKTNDIKQILNSNPVYQNITDKEWTNGYCSIFAYALHERFGVPMYAVTEVCMEGDDEGDETLIHAVGYHNFMVYDADGATLVNSLLGCYAIDAYQNHPSILEGNNDFQMFSFDETAKETIFGPFKLDWYYGINDSILRFAPITLDRLYEIHDVEVAATREAHLYINRHMKKFSNLKSLGNLSQSLVVA